MTPMGSRHVETIFLQVLTNNNPEGEVWVSFVSCKIWSVFFFYRWSVFAAVRCIKPRYNENLLQWVKVFVSWVVQCQVLSWVCNWQAGCWHMVYIFSSYPESFWFDIYWIHNIVTSLVECYEIVLAIIMSVPENVWDECYCTCSSYLHKCYCGY